MFDDVLICLNLDNWLNSFIKWGVNSNYTRCLFIPSSDQELLIDTDNKFVSPRDCHHIKIKFMSRTF